LVDAVDADALATRVQRCSEGGRLAQVGVGDPVWLALVDEEDRVGPAFERVRVVQDVDHVVVEARFPIVAGSEREARAGFDDVARVRAVALQCLTQLLLVVFAPQGGTRGERREIVVVVSVRSPIPGSVGFP
jgi:hypothetical protein